MVDIGVYCEILSPTDLSSPEILDLLGKYKVTVGQGVLFYDQMGNFNFRRLFNCLELADRLQEVGVSLALWPLLPKSMGYWINERNLDQFDRLTDSLLEGFHRFGNKPELIIADIETPWNQLASTFMPGPRLWEKILNILMMYIGNRNPTRFAWSVSRLTEIVNKLHHEDILVSCAVFPLLVADLCTKGDMLQDVLEMPVFKVPFAKLNLMFYNSYISKEAPIFIPPGSEQRALYEYGFEMRHHFGENGWLTIGSTWEGVVPGNEGKAYRAPEDLIPDIMAAKAAGIENLWLYCLEGVLFSDQDLSKRRPLSESEQFFSNMKNIQAQIPLEHPGWKRGRNILETLVKDRYKRFYHWERFENK